MIELYDALLAWGNIFTLSLHPAVYLTFQQKLDIHVGLSLVDDYQYEYSPNVGSLCLQRNMINMHLYLTLNLTFPQHGSVSDDPVRQPLGVRLSPALALELGQRHRLFCVGGHRVPNEVSGVYIYFYLLVYIYSDSDSDWDSVWQWQN